MAGFVESVVVAARDEAIRVLHADDARQAVLLGQPHEFMHAIRCFVRQADVAHLAVAHEAVKGFELFVDGQRRVIVRGVVIETAEHRYVARRPVQLVEVDDVRLQAAQAGFAGADDVGGVEAAVGADPRHRARRPGDLAGEHDLVAHARIAREPGAENGLGGAAGFRARRHRIHLGGVDEVDAARQAAVEDGVGVGFIDLFAEGHRAETDPADFKIAVAKPDGLHAELLMRMGRIDCIAVSGQLAGALPWRTMLFFFVCWSFMMKRRTALKSAFALSAVLALGSLPVHAEDFKSRTLRLGIQNPKGHPAELGARRFGELVEQGSGGKIKVRVFAGGVLGGDQQTVSSLQGGTIDMTVLNSGILASHVKEMAVYDFPFLFQNEREVEAITDGPIGKGFHERLADVGLIGLGYWELGFRHITNSARAVEKVEDLAGLKLRVIPNPINLDWVKAFGANPVPLAFPEVYTALEQKVVDGQENPLTVIAANKFFEVQKYLTLTYHQYNPQSIIISKRVWDGMSAAEQALIASAATEAGAYQRKLARDEAEGALNALRNGGMQVTELSEAELARLREKLQPVIATHTDSVGAETVQQVQAAIDAVRAAGK